MFDLSAVTGGAKAALGDYEGRACAWSGCTAVLITLGQGAQIAVNDVVTLRPDALHAPLSSASGTGSQPLQAPAVMAPLSVSVVAPVEVGACSDVVAQAVVKGPVGSSSSSLKYRWTVKWVASATKLSNPAGVTMPFASAVGGGSLGEIKLAFANIPAGATGGGAKAGGGSWKISLSYTGGFGRIVTASTLVNRRSVPIPTLEVTGGTQHRVRRGESLSLTALVGPPNCGEASALTAGELSDVRWNLLKFIGGTPISPCTRTRTNACGSWQGSTGRYAFAIKDRRALRLKPWSLPPGGTKYRRNAQTYD